MAIQPGDLPEYKSLFNGTVVAFWKGWHKTDGTPNEACLSRPSLMRVIETIKSNRDQYATQAAFERDLAVHVGAAMFMGWPIDDSSEEVSH